MLKSLFTATLALLAIAQFGSLSKDGGLNIYLFDISVFAFSAYSLATFLYRKSMYVPKSFYAFFVFGLIGLLSLTLQFNYLDMDKVLVSFFYLVKLKILLIL